MVRIRHLAVPLTLSALFATPAWAHPGHGHQPAPPETVAVTAQVQTGSGECTYQSVANWCRIMARVR